MMQHLMTDVTASIAAQTASIKGLTAAFGVQTAALAAHAAAIVALVTTVERGFQGVTAVQQPVLQQITTITEVPPWESGSGTMENKPAVLSQDDSIPAPTLATPPVPWPLPVSQFSSKDVLIISGSVFLSGCALAVQVTVKDRRMNATEGESVTLPCTYKTTLHDLSKLDIQWTFLRNSFKKHMQIYFSEVNLTYISQDFKGRLLAAHDSGNASITIEKLRPSDSGSYLCEVNNPPDFTGTNIGSVVLTVLVPPSKPECGITAHPVKAKSAILTCHSNTGVPAPTYHWMKIVKNVHQNISGHLDPKTGILIISNISEHEYGVYQCTASNVLGNQSCNVDLSIFSSDSDHIIGAIVGAVLAAVVIGGIIWVVTHKTKKNAKKNANKLLEQDTELQDKQKASTTPSTYVAVPTDDTPAASTNPNDAQLPEAGQNSTEASDVPEPPTEAPLLRENAVPSGTEKAATKETERDGA
ncbi:V-set and immunoglobulin domain-containing protein 1-like [Heptranchias perlo]|uniref:V-set and immunoglobulin domain-containing protein 1-like n=1 Tax=Heptranchias perlo TaxID=212740 RepID=UPI0035596595